MVIVNPFQVKTLEVPKNTSSVYYFSSQLTVIDQEATYSKIKHNVRVKKMVALPKP